jgi:hypothetical protein
MGGLLQPGPNHNIAPQPWRVGPKESPPFQTQVCEAELSQDRETIRHLARAVRWARRNPSPDFGTVRRHATESFWSSLPAAIRPCGAAAELIGRRVKLFGLGRIGITRWPRE